MCGVFSGRSVLQMAGCNVVCQSARRSLTKAPGFALAKPGDIYLEMRNSLGSSNFSESGIGVGCQE
jgi:hypothetical protein